MKLMTLILCISSLFFSVATKAHDGHDHELFQTPTISVKSAFRVARKAAIRMSEKDTGASFGQLHESWSKIPRENIGLFENGVGYYIVALQNKAEKKTLYVLMSDLGEVYDANFTGKFEGV